MQTFFKATTEINADNSGNEIADIADCHYNLLLEEKMNIPINSDYSMDNILYFCKTNTNAIGVQEVFVKYKYK